MLYPVCVSICAKASFNEIFLFCMVIFLSLFCAIVVRDRKVKIKNGELTCLFICIYSIHYSIFVCWYFILRHLLNEGRHFRTGKRVSSCFPVLFIHRLFLFIIGLILFSFHTADNQSRLYLSIYSVFHPGFHLSGIWLYIVWMQGYLLYYQSWCYSVFPEFGIFLRRWHW